MHPTCIYNYADHTKCKIYLAISNHTEPNTILIFNLFIQWPHRL